MGNSYIYKNFFRIFQDVFSGIHTRLNRDLFDLITETVDDIFEDAILDHVSIPRLEKEVPAGKLTLKDMRITKYRNRKPYIFQTRPSYVLKFGIQDVDVTISANYRYLLFGSIDLGKLSTGKAKLSVEGLSVTVYTTIHDTSSGGMKLKVTSCKAKVKDVELEAIASSGVNIPLKTKVIKDRAKEIIEG